MNLADSNLESETNAESKEVIMCVDIEAADLPNSIHALMTDHAFELVHSDSVYEALARISAVKPVIALVRVDWLTAAEFDFFSICTRSYPELCIFVVGDDRSQEKIERAIGLGASARLSADAVAGMLAEQCFDESALAADETEFDDWGDPSALSTDPKTPQNNSETFASPDNEFDAESEASVSGHVPGACEKTDLSAAGDLNAESAIDPSVLGGIETSGAESSGAESSFGFGGTPDTIADNSPKDSHESPDGVEHQQEPAADCGVEATEDEAENAAFGDDLDDDNRPVLVPWSQSGRGTIRVPPKRVGPGSTESPVDDAATAPEVIRTPAEESFDDPPLLSPEELSLLLGD